MVYDPTQTSYGALLQRYASTHTPRRGSGQYRSIVFYGDAEEDALARDYAARLETAPDLVSTSTPEGRFWSAEDYHQKYRLRRKTAVVQELERRFGDRWDEHSLATKLNASGNGFDKGPWLSEISDSFARSFQRS